MTRAIVAPHTGGPEVLQFTTVETPVPGPGELLVETVAAGVNFIDTYQRSGLYHVPFPFTPGAEGCGRVIAVGPALPGHAGSGAEAGADAGDLARERSAAGGEMGAANDPDQNAAAPGEPIRVGDLVTTAEGRGTYAEQFVVAAEKAVRVPEGVSAEVAAALPLQGLTAHYLANSIVRLGPGDTALVHAGAGGVGLLLTQLLAARAVRVITTASTPEKQELSVRAGALLAIGYEDFADRVRDMTGGEGVKAVFDGVGQATFDGSLRSLRVRGDLVLFGAASGPVPPFDLQRLNAGGSLRVTRPTLAHFLRTPAERAKRYGDLFTGVQGGVLDVRIGERFALADAAAAHTALEGRGTTGKVILTA
ncbi:quinone oxidoreductase family protein [Leucobacter sp. HY1910]